MIRLIRSLETRRDEAIKVIRIHEQAAADEDGQGARIAFKSWPLEKQRNYLQGLLCEHAYSYGLAGRDIMPPIEGGLRLSEDWAEGKKHREQQGKKT